MRYRPIVLAVIVIVIVVVVGGACGSDGDAPVGSVPETTTTAGPDTPVEAPADVPADVIDEPGSPERVEPRAGMAQVIPVSFEPSEVVASNGGLVIPFYGGVAPCFVLDRVEVAEAADVVTVSLFAGRDPAQPDAICIEIAKRYEVAVALREPLGGRTVVDGSREASPR